MEGISKEQFDQLAAKLGSDAAAKISAEVATYRTAFESQLTGKLSAEEFNKAKSTMEEAIKNVNDAVLKQGITVTEMLANLESGGKKSQFKSIADQLAADQDELEEIYKSRNRVKEYMLIANEKGEPVMKPFDSVKAAGPHASIGGVGGGGNTSSIAQSLDAATLLRMGSDSLFPLYRNTPWVFELANTYTVGFGIPFFIYLNETAKQGNPTEVAEGATKPLVQYAYEVRSEKYRKFAMLLGFTDEFSMDFEKLQNEILNRGKIDLINGVNSAVLVRMIAAATAYNDGAAYKIAAGGSISNANDWDAIAAMAAQAETATFANGVNAAVVSTRKKYIMGTMKDSENRWLGVPDIMKGISMVSNPAVGVNDVMVGDFKQYNIALRGGIIVKIGYNGTDFAENRYSTVLEQFYFDWISDARKPAIVKGPDFNTVKEAISA